MPIPGSKTYGFYGTTQKVGSPWGTRTIRRIDGVQDARQYTHAIPEAIESALESHELKPGDMHWRECFVVAEMGLTLLKLNTK